MPSGSVSGGEQQRANSSYQTRSNVSTSGPGLRACSSLSLDATRCPKVKQHERSNCRGKIRRRATLIDLRDELAQFRAALVCDFLQRRPKFLLKRDAGFVTANHNRPFRN